MIIQSSHFYWTFIHQITSLLHQWESCACLPSVSFWNHCITLLAQAQVSFNFQLILILCFQYANCTKPSGETNVSIQHLVLCLWFILLLRLEASTCCCTVSANCSTFLPRNGVLHKETIQSVEEHHQTYLLCVFSLCCLAKRLNLIIYFISHQSLLYNLFHKWH